MITRKERQVLECAQMQRNAGNPLRAAQYELHALQLANDRELKKAKKRAAKLAIILDCTVIVLW